MNLITKLQKNGYDIYAIAPRDKYSEKLQNKGITYIPIELDNKGTSPVNDLKFTFSLYKIYKKIQPDCLLHFTIKPNIYGSIAAKYLKIPVINNITGLGTVFLKKTIIQTITKALYKFAFTDVEKVFFQNEDDKALFISNALISEERMDILPGSGIDTNKFSPLPSKESSGKIIFLLIARVIRDKGIVEYVEAAKQLKSKYENVEFQILGQLGAINKSAISNDEVSLWEKKGYIRYLGTTDDVRSKIADATAIVLPSYREGTSKTLLEAASMAKPIVTTDVPGCNNVVENGKNGFLCRVKDPDDLAAKMEKIIKMSKEERERMGNYGRVKMINEFEEKIVIDKYLTSITALIN